MPRALYGARRFFQTRNAGETVSKSLCESEYHSARLSSEDGYGGASELEKQLQQEIVQPPVGLGRNL